ncbi:hypothetical protein E2493_14370 [Sphingomonas parva]|uniref:Sel1 repeat family protein n=1 Tax=Sphingomonas parva TaxID=2555898 RepID=A0A4Y8ZNE2_9SPHN|nr:hypothetical protein [Sphingomonas parva]TFI57553.1 hypothetical protein E2493_14370 [Sphingomonas parva]
MDRDADWMWNSYARALDILEGRASGHALPIIIRKLARRGFAPACNLLSDYVSKEEAVRLLRSAARRGDALSAYNLAITYRNGGDMRRYRTALAYAARLDPDARAELRSFKTRFPHEVMRTFHRLAPDRS